MLFEYLVLSDTPHNTFPRLTSDPSAGIHPYTLTPTHTHLIGGNVCYTLTPPKKTKYKTGVRVQISKHKTDIKNLFSVTRTAPRPLWNTFQTCFGTKELQKTILFRFFNFFFWTPQRRYKSQR